MLVRILNVELCDDGSYRCWTRQKFIENGEEVEEELPFIARQGDTEGIAPDVLKAIDEGDFDGEITPFVTAPEDEFLPAISARQFYVQLEKEGLITRQEALLAMRRVELPNVIRLFISQLGEDVAFEVEMFLIGAQSFERKHRYTNMFVAALGKTPAWGNEFWINAGENV